MATAIISKIEADELLHIEKKIVVDDMLQDVYFIKTATDFFARFPMRSLDGNSLFLMQVSQSPYNKVKIDFHFQENCQYTGLLRVDYHSTHKNPERANEHVPATALKYLGQYIQGNHIHFYVEGYRRLDWAIPLSDSDFPVKDIADADSLFAAMQAFCKNIGLTTQITAEGRLFL